MIMIPINMQMKNNAYAEYASATSSGRADFLMQGVWRRTWPLFKNFKEQCRYANKCILVFPYNESAKLVTCREIRVALAIKTQTHRRHDNRTARTSDSKQTAITPGQDAVRLCRRPGPSTGRDRHIFTGTANYPLCFTRRRLLRKIVTARTSMDVATPSARPAAAQLAGTSQPDATDQICGDHFDGVDDGRFDLDFFRSGVDTIDLAGPGSNRCDDRVADTDTCLQRKHLV